MTPKMIRALSDAELAANHRGLERTSAGWWSTLAGGRHSFQTVKALVNGGYLQLWSRGRVAHITPGGETALANWREKISRRAARTPSTETPSPG